jgi:hypothetical protein
MKFCQDCKYPEHRNALGEVHENSMCNHPKSELVIENPVTGKECRPWRSCKEMREVPWKDEGCGPDGQFFEARDPT